MNELTSKQAYWLGHLFHASSRQLALSEYAEWMTWAESDRILCKNRVVCMGSSAYCWFGD
jgi:hypothetical protein